MSVLRGSAGRLAAGLLVAALFLSCLEAGLRLLPLDRWENRSPNTSYPLFVPGTGESSGRYVTNPHFSRSMSVQSFSRVKPVGGRRIFILGGSAALGWPGAIEAAFSGYLQRALDEQFPGRYEVVNAAAMSYGSYRVLDLLTDILDFEPDLIIIWSGNNEYVERSVLTSFARTQTMGRLQRILRHSSLYRVTRLAIGTAAPQLFVRPEGEDITDPRRDSQVRRGMLGRSAETDRQVLANYRANLQAMARMLREEGVAGAFCTVPVNLSDWVPGDLALWVSAETPSSGTDQNQSLRLSQLRRQASTLGEQGNYVKVVEVLETLLQEAPQDAVGRYLLGVSYLQLGRHREAGEAFSQARDLDPRAIRALSGFERTIREVAAGEGMMLIDLEAAFAAASRSGVPGLDLFLDYVHPNEAGHKLAAITVLKDAMARIDPELPLPVMTRQIAADNWTVRHTVNQADIDYTLGMTLENNGDQRGAEQAYLRSLREGPTSEAAGNLGVIYDHRGDLSKAKEYFELALHYDPAAMHAANLALVLFRMGDHEGAHRMVEYSLRQGVVDVDNLIKLGRVETSLGNLPLAVEIYNLALAAGGEPGDLYRRIGDLYRKSGDEANAQKAYSQAAEARQGG